MADNRDAMLCPLLPDDSLAGGQVDKEEITDTCHSIRNRCLIAEFVVEHGGDPFVQTVLPTLLEDNFQDCQRLALNFCVKHPDICA